MSGADAAGTEAGTLEGRRRGAGLSEAEGAVAVAALYRFHPLADFEQRRAAVEAVCQSGGVAGTLILAAEGINGTIAGSRPAVEAVVAHIESYPGFAPIDVKWSAASVMPFIRLKVRLKREIVTMGVPDIDPLGVVGTYVEAWGVYNGSASTPIIDITMLNPEPESFSIGSGGSIGGPLDFTTHGNQGDYAVIAASLDSGLSIFDTKK